MKIKMTKSHPSGIQKGAGIDTSEKVGARFIDEGYAKKVSDKDFEELPTNRELNKTRKVSVIEELAVAKEQYEKAQAEKACAECGDSGECEDCKN